MLKSDADFQIALGIKSEVKLKFMIPRAVAKSKP